jgi:hypothetical protein
VLHPFRGDVQQPQPAELQILDHAIPLRFRQTGVKGRRRDAFRAQPVHLIFHQRDERRDDQREA